VTVVFSVVQGGSGHGRVTAFSGERLSLVAEGAFAPGAPLRLRVRSGERSEDIEGKSLGSKRLSDGGYRLDLRVFNLRRAQREWLCAVISAP